MREERAVAPLREVLKKEPQVVKKYIEIIIKKDIPVLCVNSSTKKEKTMPFKSLYGNNIPFWQQDGSWEYFIPAESQTIIEEQSEEKSYIGAIAIVSEEEKKNKPEEIKADNGFGDELEEISSLTDKQKVQKIENANNRLKALLNKKRADPEIVAEALVDTTKDAALINHSVLMDAMRHGDDEAKKITQNLVISTNEMVKTSANLMSEDIINDKMINDLVEKSNGTIVKHMTRVYLNGLSFLAYYNKLVSTSSIIDKLRVSFKTRYCDFYKRLLPHIPVDDLRLENIFFRGMRSIPPDFFNNWAIGFLVHDIGKVSAVEYHEGDSAYNRDIVIEHVKLGYNSVMNKTNYPREAGLITGYHHEYYGDDSGYGYFRSYLDQYKKLNPSLKQDYCIAYELEPMLDLQAIAYFPAKILEIIDIYDSVTDPNRKYHKAMTPDEALTMMRGEFVLKHPKIDAVLFDIFTNFIRKKYGV